jgi:hypothetical protein
MTRGGNSYAIAFVLFLGILALFFAWAAHSNVFHWDLFQKEGATYRADPIKDYYRAERSDAQGQDSPSAQLLQQGDMRPDGSTVGKQGCMKPDETQNHVMRMVGEVPLIHTSMFTMMSAFHANQLAQLKSSTPPTDVPTRDGLTRNLWNLIDHMYQFVNHMTKLLMSQLECMRASGVFQTPQEMQILGMIDTFLLALDKEMRYYQYYLAVSVNTQQTGYESALVKAWTGTPARHQATLTAFTSAFDVLKKGMAAEGGGEGEGMQGIKSVVGDKLNALF